MFLILRNVMVRDSFVLWTGRCTANDTSLWSQIGRSQVVHLGGLIPVQHIKSRMCPLECVEIKIVRIG